MADEGIFCTTAEVLRKAGANASSVSTAEAYTNDFVAQAESLINAETQYNWSDEYTNLNQDLRDILKLAASAKAAMMCINYDLTGFGTRERETMLDILKDEYNMAIKLLRDQNVKSFVLEE